MRAWRACAVAFAVVLASGAHAQTQTLGEITAEILKASAEEAAAQRKQNEPKVTFYETEALRYAEAARKGLPAEMHAYWQRMLEIADRLDRGQISVEAANQLANVYYEPAINTMYEKDMAKMSADAKPKRETAARELEESRRQAAAAALLRAQEDSLRRQRAADLIQGGINLMTPQPVARPTCQPNYACMSDCQRKGWMPGYCNAQCGCP